MAVDFDDGGVNHDVFHVRLLRTGFEKPNENIGFDPAAISREDTVSLAEEDRRVPPRTSGTSDPKRGFYEEPFVLTASAGVCLFAQAKRLHLCPLGVRQY